MSIQWVGLLPFILFSMLCAFVFAGLFLLYKAAVIICLSFEIRTKSNILKPLFFLLAYSLISVLFRQAASFKMITFNAESTELFFNLSSGMIYIGAAAWLLLKILNDSQVMNKDCISNE